MTNKMTSEKEEFKLSRRNQGAKFRNTGRLGKRAALILQMTEPLTIRNAGWPRDRLPQDRIRNLFPPSRSGAPPLLVR